MTLGEVWGGRSPPSKPNRVLFGSLWALVVLRIWVFLRFLVLLVIEYGNHPKMAADHVEGRLHGRVRRTLPDHLAPVTAAEFLP